MPSSPAVAGRPLVVLVVFGTRPDEAPDWLLVQGDTTTAVGAALAAAVCAACGD